MPTEMLLRDLENKFSYNQKKRYNKIYNENFYLLGIERFPDLYKISVSGSSQNIYSVNIYLDRNVRPKCSCPDARGWAPSSNCLCKHVCFVLFRVLKCWYLSFKSSNFFGKENSTFLFKDDEHFLMLDALQKVYSRFDTLNYSNVSDQNISEDKEVVNCELLLKYMSLKENEDSKEKENKKGISKEIKEDDVCPICYCEFMEDGKVDLRFLIECPNCNNVFHKECMNKWLNMGKKNCVYCRSDIWEKYNKVTGLYEEGEYKNLNLC